MSAIHSETLLSRLSTKIKSLLPKDRFARSAMILAGGTTLSQVFIVASSPLLTRLYIPNDFGILAIYTSLLAISLNVSSFRYEFAIPLSKDNQTAIDVLVLCIVLVFFMSMLFALCSFFFYSELFQIQRISSLKQYVWLLPFGFLLAGAYQIFTYWGIREQIYPTIARTKMSQSISNVLTQVGCGVLEFGPLGLLLGHVIGQSAGLGTLSRKFWKTSKKNLHSVSFDTLRSAAYRYRRFLFFQSNASLLNSAGLEVAPLLLASYYGLKVAGWFYLTQKVLGVPFGLIGASVSAVFLGEAARLSNDAHKLRKLYKNIAFKVFIIGLPPAIVLSIGGQWIFKVIFGAEWAESGAYVQLMAFVFLFKLTFDSVINFAIIERQDLSFLWALFRFGFVVGGIMSAVWLDLSGLWAVAFFSAAILVSYLMKFILWEYAVKKLIKAEV